MSKVKIEGMFNNTEIDLGEQPIYKYTPDETIKALELQLSQQTSLLERAKEIMSAEIRQEYLKNKTAKKVQWLKDYE